MKKIKYLLAIILFIIGFIFTGELYMFFLDNFQELYYRCSFYFDSVDIDNNVIVEDFLSASEKNQTDFFTVDFKIESEYKKVIKIYGTDGALEYLRNHEIRENQQKSLFSGCTEVIYKSISECDSIKKQEFFYFIGDDTELLQGFKAELIDKYGGGFPKLYGTVKNTIMDICTVWGIILTILILFSVYEITIQQKEYSIRMILGYDLKNIFIKNVLIDIAVFTGLFAIIPWLLFEWINTYFFIEIVVILFVVFLVIDVAINLLIFKTNIKKNFSNVKGNSSILKINYGIKVITLLIVSAVISVNISLISEGVNYYQQRDFFEKNSYYKYYQLNYKMTSNDVVDKSEYVMQKFYNDFAKNSILFADFTEQLSINYPTVLINKNSTEELFELDERWKEVLFTCQDNKIYLIIPEKIQQDMQIHTTLDEICNTILGYEEENEKIYYEEKLDSIVISSAVHTFKSKLYSCPILIYDNRKPVMDKEASSMQLYYAYDILYNISDDEFAAFVEENKLENEIVKVTNAGEAYQYNWEIVRRFTKITIVLSIIMIFLEYLMLFTVIKLDYYYNAKQIVLMKILGYSRIRRNIRPILLTIICGFVVTILVLLGTYFRFLSGGIWGIMSIIGFIVIEIVIIVWKSKMLEKKKIALILKGESL